MINDLLCQFKYNVPKTSHLLLSVHSGKPANTVFHDFKSTGHIVINKHKKPR